MFMALALVAGLTWASQGQNQTAQTPPGTAFTVTSVVTPGSSGGEVFGPTEQEDEMDFSVGFDPSAGTVSINGGTAVACCMHHQYTVTSDYVKVGLVWIVSTEVRCSGGSLIASDYGRIFDSAPPAFHASAMAVHGHNAQ